MPRKTPTGLVVGVILGALLAVTAGVGLLVLAVYTGRSGGGNRGEGVERLDLFRLKQELTDNRPAALNRYIGKTVEIPIEALSVKGGSADEIQLGLTYKGGWEPEVRKLLISFRATCEFGDSRNEQLKSVKQGLYEGAVRGIIKSISHDYRLDYDVVELDPAWLPGPLAPRPSP